MVFFLVVNDYSVSPGLMEKEKWWKLPRYVQLDLEEENNFKRKMLHSSLFTRYPRLYLLRFLLLS